MKRLVAAMAGCLFLAGALATAQAPRPRVSVTPLTFSLGVLEGEVRALASLFETALVQGGAFTVVKQDELATILAAQEASLQDFADRDGAVELGKIASASQVFVGAVAKLGRSYVVSLQLVDVTTGRAVKAESDEVLSPEAFSAAARRLADLFGQGGGAAAPVAAAPQQSPQSASDAERIRTYTAIGDRFMELRRYDAALAQYEKARLVAEFDVDVLWRIVTAMKQKLLSATLYSGDAIQTGLDVALREDTESLRFAPREQIDALLEKLYTIEAIQPLLEDDVSLLTDEAQVLKVDGKLDDARTTLRRALRMYPDDPTVLAELGLLEAFQTGDAERARAGLGHIGDAIRRSPETALFELYLGRSLERIAKAPDAEALRAYRRAAALASAPDFWTQRIRSFAERSMARAYYAIGALPGGVLTEQLSLPVAERLEQMQFLVAREVPFTSRTSTQNPALYLAVLSLAAGMAEQAEAVCRRALAAEPESWAARDVPLLEVLEKALAQIGADPSFLDKVRIRLKELRK